MFLASTLRAILTVTRAQDTLHATHRNDGEDKVLGKRTGFSAVGYGARRRVEGWCERAEPVDGQGLVGGGAVRGWGGRSQQSAGLRQRCAGTIRDARSRERRVDSATPHCRDGG